MRGGRANGGGRKTQPEYRGLVRLDNVRDGLSLSFVNITEAARYLHISIKCIKKLIDTGRASKHGWVVDMEI